MANNIWGNDPNAAASLVMDSIHVVKFTVAPFAAPTADKSRADYVCSANGANQVEIMAAINAAKTQAGALGMCWIDILPGEYVLSAAIVVPPLLKSVIVATGTVMSSSSTTADFWNFDGCSHCRFHLGYHNTATSGAGIHVNPTTVGWAENVVSWQGLDGPGAGGVGNLGYGLRIQNGTYGSSASRYIGTAVAGLTKGISVEAANTGANIDTNVYDINFIRDCAVSVYEHGTGATTINAATWNINVEASYSGAIAIQTNGQKNNFNAIIYGAAGGTIIQLDSGATDNTFATLPNILDDFGSSFVVDNSGNTTNRYGAIGAALSVGLSAKGHFTKWSTTKSHTLVDAGPNLGLPDGNSGAPSLTFDSNTAIGIYKSGGSSVGVVGILEPITGQIKFPAAQNPSSDANTLDDYEKGTFTPGLTFAAPGDVSFTAGTAIGAYVKIGAAVTICFNRISQVTYTTAAGNLQFTGLPFASYNTTGLYFTGGLRWQGITKASYTDISPSLGPNALIGNFNASGSGQTRAPVTTADVPTGSQLDIEFSMTYFV